MCVRVRGVGRKHVRTAEQGARSKEEGASLRAERGGRVRVGLGAPHHENVNDFRLADPLRSNDDEMRSDSRGAREGRRRLERHGWRRLALPGATPRPAPTHHPPVSAPIISAPMAPAVGLRPLRRREPLDAAPHALGRRAARCAGGPAADAHPKRVRRCLEVARGLAPRAIPQDAAGLVVWRWEVLRGGAEVGGQLLRVGRRLPSVLRAVGRWRRPDRSEDVDSLLCRPPSAAYLRRGRQRHRRGRRAGGIGFGGGGPVDGRAREAPVPLLPKRIHLRESLQRATPGAMGGSAAAARCFGGPVAVRAAAGGGGGSRQEAVTVLVAL